jgi:hypothetical protein
MAEESVFRGTIEFFEQLGLFDVVLPFLLVFTIIFAILEKTKVLGTEEIEGKKWTKKNLNAMTAFVIAFITVASSQLVEIITKVSSHVVLLLLLSVFFLLLVGSFFKEGEGVFLPKGWDTVFMVIMFLGIALIFLSAIETKDGTTWLRAGGEWLADNASSQAVASIILLVIIIGAIFFITIPRGSPAKSKEKKEV